MKIEWETFCDVSYYHLWRVRRKTERGFDDGFHLESGEEARDLVELLNRMERERVEARRERDEWRKCAERLSNSAAYALGQWEQGYTLEGCREISVALQEFTALSKEGAK